MSHSILSHLLTIISDATLSPLYDAKLSCIISLGLLLPFTPSNISFVTTYSSFPSSLCPKNVNFLFSNANN